MDQTSHQPNGPGPVKKSSEDARSGTPVRGMPTVLIASTLAAAVVLLALALFYLGSF